jgi:hypothetical protein
MTVSISPLILALFYPPTTGAKTLDAVVLQTKQNHSALDRIAKIIRFSSAKPPVDFFRTGRRI